MAKAKTINLLLNDGTLKGVISMEDSSWNKGELYSAPRESVDDLVNSDACYRYGVYLLLSEDMVYVGQASDLSRRIKQHLMGKSWWERVVILTTSDDSLNRSDIDYIEASLISKASSTGRLDCDNKNMGNKQKVSKFREVELEQYLEEALFLLELIGVNVFCAISKKKSMSKTELIASIKNSSKDQVELRDKKEAIRFLIENGINVGKNMNYSKRQDNKNVFWINPRTNAIEKDWDLILNNQYENEIIVLHIPAGSFQLKSEVDNGLLVRHDKPDRIDLTISDDTLIDQRSKCEFSMYVVKKIKY
ncbi:MAG: GIY-YIG nuclease family protein [Ruminococcaceae bacterium]|nr:GIY-YIG nuclease family protein [Oscillospiraceae bacterium]